MCGISGFLTAVIFGMRAFNQTISGFWTRFFRRHHTVLVGDSQFTENLAESLEIASLQCVKFNDEDNTVCLQTALKRAGVNRADRIIVDKGDDTLTLRCLYQIYSEIKDGDIQPRLAGLVRERDIANIFPLPSDQCNAPENAKAESDTLSGQTMPDLAECIPVLFNDARLLARQSLSVTPLFLRAAARGQKKVHALILGYGAIGEALMEQVLLTSIARGLDKPEVTVVDPVAVIKPKGFETGRQNYYRSLGVNVYTRDVIEDLRNLSSGSCEAPRWIYPGPDTNYTMIYVVLDSQAENLKTAGLIRKIQSDLKLLNAPITFICRSADDNEAHLLDFCLPAQLPLNETEGVIRLSLSTEAFLNRIDGLSKTETLAAEIHYHYCKDTAASESANLIWSKLDETYKWANRTVVDHYPAKLWSADIRPEALTHPTEADRSKIKQLLERPDSDPLIQQLARLEHERWSLERTLQGWTYNPERDDRRRHHDLLVDFDDLPVKPDQIYKDVSQVRFLLSKLL